MIPTHHLSAEPYRGKRNDYRALSEYWAKRCRSTEATLDILQVQLEANLLFSGHLEEKIALQEQQIRHERSRVIDTELELATLRQRVEGNATPGEIAQAFHEAYEELAPHFGYATRPESAVSWNELAESHKALMVATIRNVFYRTRSTSARRSQQRKQEQGRNSMSWNLITRSNHKEYFLGRANRGMTHSANPAVGDEISVGGVLLKIVRIVHTHVPPHMPELAPNSVAYARPTGGNWLTQNEIQILLEHGFKESEIEERQSMFDARVS